MKINNPFTSLFRIRDNAEMGLVPAYLYIKHKKASQPLKGCEAFYDQLK